MKLHELKTDQKAFKPVFERRKSFEIRINDRNFKVGDRLWLRETKYTGEQMKNGKPLIYTGYDAWRNITHILKGPIYGLAKNWCILSIS